MNMKINILLLSCTALLMGILLYAFQHQWIIFRGTSALIHTKQPQIKTKKKCILHYWHNNRWHTESQELIWSSHVDENLVTLISSWLSLLDTEQLLPKKVMLQSATLTPHQQEAYLSFDRNIFPKEWSIHRKLMLIEGLSKTIRSNTISLHGIHMLVHHQPLIDMHLDFSDAWPTGGFL
jgi:hypothetical protein